MKTALEPGDLHKAVHGLLLLYNHRFELVLPALNYSLILFKHIKSLALPSKRDFFGGYEASNFELMLSVELYVVVRRLASLLAVDFTFPKPGPRQRKSAHPEIQLVSLLVIAVKLYHPFDSQPRYSRTLSEFGTLVIDWDVWCKSQTEYAARHTSAGKLGRGNEINVNENDVMAMSGEQLDEYLDWYEKTWIKEESQEPQSRRIPQQLLDLFPTGRYDGSSQAKVDLDQEARTDQIALDQKLKIIQGNLNLRNTISEESNEQPVKRIGSFYKRYRNIDDLSPEARIFYEAAATSVGMSLASLTLAVIQLERKLETLRDNEVKNDLLEDEDLSESGQESQNLDEMDVSGGEQELNGGY